MKDPRGTSRAPSPPAFFHHSPPPSRSDSPEFLSPPPSPPIEVVRNPFLTQFHQSNAHLTRSPPSRYSRSRSPSPPSHPAASTEPTDSPRTRHRLVSFQPTQVPPAYSMPSCVPIVNVNSEQHRYQCVVSLFNFVYSETLDIAMAQWLDNFVSHICHPTNHTALSSLGRSNYFAERLRFPSSEMISHYTERQRVSIRQFEVTAHPTVRTCLPERAQMQRDLPRLDVLRALHLHLRARNLHLSASDQSEMESYMDKYSFLLDASYGTTLNQPLRQHIEHIYSAADYLHHNRLATFYGRPILDPAQLNVRRQMVSVDLSQFNFPLPPSSSSSSLPAPAASGPTLQASCDEFYAQIRAESSSRAQREVVRQASERDLDILAGKSSDYIDSTTPKAPLTSIDEDFDNLLHECSKEHLEKRKAGTASYRRLATLSLIAAQVGLNFLFSSERILQSIIVAHQNQLFRDATSNGPTTSSDMLTLIPNLLELPVVKTIKFFEQFIGLTPWTDLSVRHFAPPSFTWGSLPITS